MKPRVSELSECITEEEIALLAAVFGPGQRLFIPSTTANAQALEIIIGLAATSNLVHRLGGNYVYLPGLPTPTGHARQPSLAQVKAMSQGPERMSAIRIAREFRCSVRTVYGKRAEILRREREGIPLTAQPGRKQIALKNARARQRRDARPQEAASLRRSVSRSMTDD